MEALKKYSYGQSFIDESGHIINPEIEAAKAEGHQAGYDQGYAQAKSELESDILAMITVLNMRLEELNSNQKEAYQYVTSSTIEVVKAITNKVLPYLLARNGDQEVEGMVAEVLKGLKSNGQITIEVHPALQKAIEAKVQEMMDGQIKILVKSDESIDRTDCRIQWDDGGVEHIKSKLIQGVDQALQRVLDNSPVEQTKTGEGDV